MVLGFLKRGPGSVGCYGKLPLHGDYVSHASDGSEARFLSSWLDEGYRQTPGRDRPDAAEVGFILAGRRGRKALIGSLWPSRDASGTRRFPFALFVPTPPKPLVSFGGLLPVAITPSVVNLVKAFPEIREAATLDRIMHLISGIPVPPLAEQKDVKKQFTHEADQTLSAGAAMPVLFEVLRFTEILGGGKKGDAPSFAVRIPLRTEFSPAMESATWLTILAEKLSAPALATECHLFVRPGRSSQEGEMFVIHRKLRPEDLGFVLGATEDYPYGNFLGDDGDDPDVAAFVSKLDEESTGGFTLSDLLNAAD